MDQIVLKNNISILTGSRFLAALVVLISHTYAFTFGNESNNVFNTLSVIGGAGVLYFFILSGFIISYNYLDKISNSHFNSWYYLFLRFIRIYPLYFVMLIVYIINNLYINNIIYLKQNLFAIFSNLFLIQSYLPSSTLYTSCNPPGWSISTEFFFYIAFICIFKLFKVKKIFPLFLVLLFLNLFWSIVYSYFLPDILHIWAYYPNPFYRVTDFISGSIIYLLLRKNKLYLTYWPALFLQLCSFLMIYLAYSFASQHVEAKSFRFLFHNVGMFLVCIIITSQILSAKYSFILSSKIFQFLGNASFCLYLTHYFILQHFAIKNSIGRFYTLIVVCIIISSLIYKFVENPFHNMLKKIAVERWGQNYNIKHI